ncbi:MAG: glycosyltransferase family 2 protein [Armatimonadota bacterium]
MSIAIVNWNATRFLTECLQSLQAHPPSAEHEIIVVDNASQDFDEPSFRTAFPNVTLIVNRDNAGYAAANNQAIAISRGEYVLLLNPDTRVTEHALDTLIGFMDSYADAAACGAKLIRPDGSVEHSVRSFPYPAAIAFEFTGLARILRKSRRVARYRMRWFTYDEVAEVDQPMGSCLILRRRAIEQVGALDESFPIFFNEVDWLYRAKQMGWKVYFTPAAVVVHHGAASTGKAGRRRMIRESHESLIRFYAKHFRSRIPAPVYFVVVACIRVGALFRR